MRPGPWTLIPGIFFPHGVIIGITARGIVVVVSAIATAKGSYWGDLVVIESVGVMRFNEWRG